MRRLLRLVLSGVERSVLRCQVRIRLLEAGVRDHVEMVSDIGVMNTRVDQLEDLLREHDIPIPPIDRNLFSY